jgi:very-short-patch-repair endonuclease
VDFLFRQERVVVEFDGAVKYGGAAQSGQLALVAEKRREDAIRRLGYVVVRLTWADLRNPERVGALVRAAFRQAAA